MHVGKIILRGFRNYRELSLELSEGINLLIGANAQGKTNILESLYLAAVGKSHRSANEEELIAWDEREALVDIDFFRRGTLQKLAFRFVRQKQRSVLLNGFAVKNREAVGLLNTVLFSPEDLWLIKGGPSARRRFLDGEISQANPVYYGHLLSYNRILSQRNHLLKQIRERRAAADSLSTWDEQFAASAAAVCVKRREAVRKLSMLANLMQRKLTGGRENLALAYEGGPSGDQEKAIPQLQEWYLSELQRLRPQDLGRGSTSVGPHRDDLDVSLNGRSLRLFGSQGQQRTGILALKLAELEFIKSETGEYPILLLDDVMSELDSSRRSYLLSFIKDRIQTVITATDDAFFPEKTMARRYRVTAGSVSE